MQTSDVVVTVNGAGALRCGALVIPRTKDRAEQRFPEAARAVQLFAIDPPGLARLLAEFPGTLRLSLASAESGSVLLSVVCDGAMLAGVKLRGPDYRVGMGACAAARKAGVLPPEDV